MTVREPTVETRRIYKGRVISLRVDTVQLSQGRVSQRELVEHGGSVAIVPLDGKKNVLLVRQYRKAIEQTLLEVPAGGLREGEAPEACARRELEEETGYTAARLEHMGSFFMTPGYCDEEMHTFLATGLKEGRPQPDFDEDIQVVPAPLDSIPGMIQRGEIRDAKSIAALLLTLGRTRPAS